MQRWGIILGAEAAQALEFVQNDIHPLKGCSQMDALKAETS